MNVCKHHEKAVIVYSSKSCPLCDAGGILEAADQTMSRAIRMVNTVRRALSKNREEYCISTLDVAGDFIDKSREEVGRVRKILSGRVLKKEQEGEQ